MNAETLLSAIDNGRTVSVGTCTRVTVWSPSAAARQRKAGAEPFRTSSDGCLQMIEGWRKGRPRYVTLGLSNGRLLVGIRID